MTTLWKNSSLLLDMANGNQSEGNQFLWSQKTLQSEMKHIHIFLSHLIIFKELTKSSTTPFYDNLHLQGTYINEKNSISRASREVYGKLIKNFLCFKRKRFVRIISMNRDIIVYLRSRKFVQNFVWTLAFWTNFGKLWSN